MPSRVVFKTGTVTQGEADFDVEATRIFTRMPDGKWQRGMRQRTLVKSRKAALRLLNAIVSRIVTPE